MDIDDVARHLDGWAPGPEQRTGRIDAWSGEAFAALLDQDPPGDALPPLWHWFHLLDHPARSELGDDGHPAHGRFLPPLPDRRRMFAGGRLEQRVPLRVGDEVTRHSSLVSAVPKAGRSGAGTRPTCVPVSPAGNPPSPPPSPWCDRGERCADVVGAAFAPLSEGSSGS